MKKSKEKPEKAERDTIKDHLKGKGFKSANVDKWVKKGMTREEIINTLITEFKKLPKAK